MAVTNPPVSGPSNCVTKSKVSASTTNKNGPFRPTIKRLHGEAMANEMGIYFAPFLLRARPALGCSWGETTEGLQSRSRTAIVTTAASKTNPVQTRIVDTRERRDDPSPAALSGTDYEVDRNSAKHGSCDADANDKHSPRQQAPQPDSVLAASNS